MPRGLISLLIFVGALVVLGVLVWPNYQEFLSVSGQAKDIKTTLEKRDKYFASLDQVFRNLERDSQTLQKFDQALPQKPDPDQLIYFLSLAGRNSGLILQEVEGLAAVPLQGADAAQGEGRQFQLKEIRFSAKFTGTYPSFKNFLKEVESSARLFEVERVSILPPLTSANLAPQSGAIETLRFEVGLKAYSY